MLRLCALGLHQRAPETIPEAGPPVATKHKAQAGECCQPSRQKGTHKEPMRHRQRRVPVCVATLPSCIRLVGAMALPHQSLKRRLRMLRRVVVEVVRMAARWDRCRRPGPPRSCTRQSGGLGLGPLGPRPLVDFTCTLQGSMGVAAFSGSSRCRVEGHGLNSGLVVSLRRRSVRVLGVPRQSWLRMVWGTVGVLVRGRRRWGRSMVLFPCVDVSVRLHTWTPQRPLM
mmetsp:Transcript_95547/g.247021  ORF Transcript_95547/g.247021 Transcript_95547/m.247021 type:complete len:227 (+) Transcript_95547:212-892(+)